MRLKPTFFLLLWLCFAVANAQKKEVHSGNDSTIVYKKIENLSQKSKFNRFIYKLLFKSNRQTKVNAGAKRRRFLIKKSFDRNEGKIIRNINIETLDPFGYSVDNYKDQPEKALKNSGTVCISSRKTGPYATYYFSKKMSL